MKTRLVKTLFFLLYLGSCSYAQSKKDNLTEENLKIKYVSLSIMTPIRVECSNFESYFDQSIKVEEITAKPFFYKFFETLNSLEEIDENYSSEPDTRIKIEAALEDTSKIICVGNLVVSYDGKSYKNNDKFKKLILDVLK
jgi:hypothetical protein